MRRNSSGKYGATAIIISALVVLGAALAARHGLLESGVLPRDCSLTEAQSGLCVFKTVLVQSFMQQRVGWFSLACGVLAFALGCRRLAWAGWLSGLAGLVFYSYDPAVWVVCCHFSCLRARASSTGRARTRPVSSQAMACGFAGSGR